VIEIEILELYYKRYTGTVKASDYVEWANHCLYLDVPEIKKLASMSMAESLNLFEIEGMFADALKAAQIKAPSEELCLHNYLRNVHAQLLMPDQDAMLIVKEIYDCTISHEIFLGTVELAGN